MKKFIVNIWLLLFALFSMTSCGEMFPEEVLHGRAYEVVVVCDQPQWQSALGDTLQSVLQAPVKELMFYEPMYNVMRVLPMNFKDYTRLHRNIIYVNVNPSIEKPGIYVQYDRFNDSQLYMVIQGPSNHVVAEYVSENREHIYHVIEKMERERDAAFAKRNPAKKLKNMIKEKFGLTMELESNYMLRMQSDDMVWISKEYTTSSQGFFIYKYPYTGPESLSAEALIEARNKFVSRIPGPGDNSYMITVEQIPDQNGEKYVPLKPNYNPLRLGDMYWIEMYGWWEMANAFMGGPYISYTTVNKKTNEVVTLDCYLYSPKEKKRNYFRKLQHLVHQIKFAE